MTSARKRFAAATIAWRAFDGRQGSCAVRHEWFTDWALFEIEVASSTLPSTDVIFTDSVLTFANAEPDACTPDAFGPMDYYTAPHISGDGKKCCLERIVLREMGVPATTMDP